jgi:tRNA(fMet)-specific endonuclease VapC
MFPVLRSKILSCQPSDVKISAVVKAELLYGAEKSIKRDENRLKILSFLAPFEVIPFKGMAIEYYARIRSDLEKAGTLIGPNDLFIAATVLADDGVLITNNAKEFNRVHGLRLDNWTV